MTCIGEGTWAGAKAAADAAATAADLVAGGERAAADIDAHHGNGTQAIFWNDPAVFYGSVHVDPAVGWFPHTVGHSDEADDADTNRNVPVEPGSGDDQWLAACRSLLADVARFRPDAIVVSLGVDAAADDPNSPLLVSDAGFGTVGQLLGHLDRPTVFVHEGGYVLQTLAQHTMAVLEGFESRPGW